LMEEVVTNMREKARYFSIPRLPPGQFIDLLTEIPALDADLSLLILDDIDHAQVADPAETFERLGELPRLSICVTSSSTDVHLTWYEALGRPERTVEVRDLTYLEAREMLASIGHIGPPVHRALGEFGGNPGRLLAWAREEDPALLDARALKLATVLGPDGKALDPHEPAFRRIELEVKDRSERLMRALVESPELMYRLSSRDFEETVAALWEKSGYEVELTRASKDGGVDFYAFQKSPFGSYLTVVDTKRYRPDRPIEVGLVRGLYGTTVSAGASAGVIATTSYFTAGARSYQEERQHRLGLQDFISLKDMLKRSTREAAEERRGESE
jgi:hypothetical protein